MSPQRVQFLTVLVCVVQRRGSSEILRGGGGVSKEAKPFKGKCEAKLEFQEGWGIGVPMLPTTTKHFERAAGLNLQCKENHMCLSEKWEIGWHSPAKSLFKLFRLLPDIHLRNVKQMSGKISNKSWTKCCHCFNIIKRF